MSDGMTFGKRGSIVGRLAGKFLSALLLFAVLPLVASCSKIKTEAKYPSGYDRTTTGGDIYGERDSIFGKGGFKIGGKKKDKYDGSTGIGVNSYLWRASLDTVSFMPLASADPFGGVIITEWYVPEEKKNERFKINVFILDKHLTSNGVKVKIFRQVKEGGGWRDAKVAKGADSQMEEAILTRARELRVAELAEE